MNIYESASYCAFCSEICRKKLNMKIKKTVQDLSKPCQCYHGNGNYLFINFLYFF